MSPRASTKPISFLMAACLAATSPIGATAQTQMMAGFNPHNPFGSAAQLLWQRIQQQCNPQKWPVVIGIASRPATRDAFTTDQGNNIMQQIRAAFSNIPGVSMAPWLDMDPIKGIVDTGVLDNPMAGDNKEQLSKIQIEIKAFGQKVGSAARFNLSAQGWNGYDCSPSLDPFIVSQEFIGEEYASTDQIFTKVAANVWQESVDTSNPLTLSVRMLSGLPVSAGWQEFFADKMRRALSKQNAEEKETRVRAERHVSLVIAHDPSGIEDRRWDGMVTVDPRPTGYRISVSISRKNTTPISEDGMVTLDELPTMQQWAALGPSQRRSAPTPRLGEAPLRINGELDGGRAMQLYPFAVARESYVEIDIPTGSVRGSNPALPVDVLGPNNAPLRTIHIVNPSRPNLRRYRLAAGEYTIRVAGSGPSRQEFQLRARAVDTTGMLAPEAPGRLLRRFQDWFASVAEDPRTGRRTCFAYTGAVEAGPGNWREQAPFILLQAQSDGNGAIQHLIEDKRYYKPGAPFEVMVNEGSAQRRLNAAPKPDGNFIRPEKPGSDGKPILDMDAVAGYNRGTTIEITGTIPDGRPAHVVYSLQGYRAAVNAMSLECGRRDLANALVWK